MTNHLEHARKMHAEFSLRNWSDPGPVMDYVFLHMTEFFRHAIIHRSGPISRLEPAPNPEIPALKVETKLGTMPLDDYVQQGPVNGVVVLHRGKLAYERYPRMREHDKHMQMSVSKIFASTLIGILEDRGEIDIDQPVETYLPEVAGSGWEGVAVRDVLDMCSGIACLESDVEDAYSNPERCYYQYEASLDWLEKTAETRQSTYEYVASLKRGREPGEAFEYTSINTFMLSWLVERITGLPYAEAITRELWSKIGAESDAVITVSEINAPGSHGGISATVRDIARLGLLFTPSWKTVSSEQVVSNRYLQQIRESGRPEIFDKAGTGQGIIERLRGERPRHNTYQWDFVTEDGDFYKGGYGGQGLYISPRRDLVVAFAGTPTHDGENNEMVWAARQLAKSGLV